MTKLSNTNKVKAIQNSLLIEDTQALSSYSIEELKAYNHYLISHQSEPLLHRLTDANLLSYIPVQLQLELSHYTNKQDQTYVHLAATKKSNVLSSIPTEILNKVGGEKDEWGQTFIHIATNYGNLHKIDKNLVSNFGDIKNTEGNTFLHIVPYSSYRDYTYIEKEYLHKFGNIKNNNGETFLHTAAHMEIISSIPKELLFEFAPILDNKNQTFLHLIDKNTEMVENHGERLLRWIDPELVLKIWDINKLGKHLATQGFKFNIDIAVRSTQIQVAIKEAEEEKSLDQHYPVSLKIAVNPALDVAYSINKNAPKIVMEDLANNLDIVLGTKDMNIVSSSIDI